MRRALESIGFAVRELAADGSVRSWERGAGSRHLPHAHHAQHQHADDWADWMVLPGGFAQGDALRPGALAARAPVLQQVRAHVARGRLVLGVCNGFQILTEAKLLGGALLPNADGRFVAIDREVELVAAAPNGDGSPALVEAFASVAAGVRPLRLPIANATGRYVSVSAPAEHPTIPALRYRRPPGTVVRGDSAQDAEIAGVIGGPFANVIGLMPHPERAMEDERGAPADGRLFFEALCSYDRLRP